MIRPPAAPCSRSSASHDLDLRPRRTARRPRPPRRARTRPRRRARSPRRRPRASRTAPRRRGPPSSRSRPAPPGAGARGAAAAPRRRARSPPGDGTRRARFLPSGRSTPVLPPIERVDLGDERRRDLDPGHAAEIGRREEPRRVAERAAADRDQRLPALDPQPGELARRVLDDRQPLRVLARRAACSSLHRPAELAQVRGERPPRTPPMPRARRRGSPAAPPAVGAPRRRPARRCPRRSTTSPIRRRRAQEGRRRGHAGRDQPLDRLHDAADLGDAVHAGRGRRRTARGPPRAGGSGPSGRRPGSAAARWASGAAAARGPRAARRARPGGGRGRAPSGCAGRRSRRRPARSPGGGSGDGSGGPSAATASRSSAPERRLALAREDLRDRAAGRRARSGRRGRRTSRRGATPRAARRRSCR